MNQKTAVAILNIALKAVPYIEPQIIATGPNEYAVKMPMRDEEGKPITKELTDETDAIDTLCRYIALSIVESGARGLEALLKSDKLDKVIEAVKNGKFYADFMRGFTLHDEPTDATAGDYTQNNGVGFGRGSKRNLRPQAEEPVEK